MYINCVTLQSGAPIDAALRALAHPARRRLLRHAWDAERTSTELATHTGLSRPATSQHLGVLRAAGLVAVRVDANRRLYRARRKRLAQVRRLVEAFWEDRLDALQAAAEEEARSGG